MQSHSPIPISPEVRAYAEWQREREFEVVNTEAKQKWWRRLGAKVLEKVQSPEVNVSGEFVISDEIVSREEVETRARLLIENFESKLKTLRENEAEDNARTALFEALTASGHMSVVELSGDIYEVHEQVVQRLLNSYFRDGIAQHERDRNFAELCEELTVQATFEAIVRGDVPPDTKILTASDYAHPLGKEADKHGYRSANYKGMVRETMLQNRDEKFVRVIKQVSRSNTYAPETIKKLQKAGVPLAPRRGETDVQLLSNQWLSVRHGAIEVVQLLDRLQRGFSVRFGEPITARTISYEQLEAISEQREQAVEFHVKELADYERTLDTLLTEGKISLVEQRKRYVEAVREHVRAICVRFPDYTKDALGEEVVKDYRRAHAQYTNGDAAGATRTVGGASSREQAVVICGGSTEASQRNPNNPDAAKDQTLQPILERSLEEDWEGHTTCPACRKNVYAKRRSGVITGSCGHSLEICTGKWDFKDPNASTEGEATLPETNVSLSTRNFNAEFQAIVEQQFGEGAVAKERVAVGETRTDIVGRGGTVIATDVKLGQLALARNG